MTLVGFQLTLDVDLFTITSGELQCTCQGSLSTVHVTLRQASNRQNGFSTKDDAATSEWGPTGVECIATCELEPEERVVSALGDLEANRLPPGSIHPSERKGIFDADGSLRPNHGIDLSCLPGWFQEFRHEIYRELYECATRMIKLVRWHCNAHGGPKAIRSDAWLKWCWDGQPWQLMPPHLDWPGGEEVLPVSFDPNTQSTICSKMHLSELNEPVGHELFREAWELRRSRPRSALTLGIAAAEAGIKQFIVDTEPGTKWIVENLPSPPLSDLLRKYLPIMLEDHNIRNPASRPPNRLIMDPLVEGVKMRNRVVHGIDIPIEHDSLERALLAIRDILWMLDVYRGHEWARPFLRPETLEAWDPDHD